MSALFNHVQVIKFHSHNFVLCVVEESRDRSVEQYVSGLSDR